MDSRNKLNITFLSTCLPRECGLATFTNDLIDGLQHIEDFNNPKVIAVNNNRTYAYGNHVMTQINQHQRIDYRKAALEINCSKTDLLVIQHEFGIYGGESGVYLLDLVEQLKIPFIVIFHTVLKNPTPMQHFIVEQLGVLSCKVVTMSQSTVENLRDVYGIPQVKIEMFHHGVPFVSTASRQTLKSQYEFENRTILSTFGFLSPGKGIEYAIEAMSGVVAKHPEALYMVLGKTHPVVKQEIGEVYRHKLIALVSKLGLENNVQFINKLLTQEEVVESLVMSDIYITPYLGKDQAVSGTLAYGVGYGRVIISTPYRYATEMLANGRGLLAGFRDSASLEACILQVLDNPQEKNRMEEQTLSLGQTMMWRQVSKQYARLFRESVRLNNTYNGRVS